MVHIVKQINNNNLTNFKVQNSKFKLKKNIKAFTLIEGVRLPIKSEWRSSSDSVKPRGFTLIELMVVIAIIAILSVVGVASFTTVLKNSRDSKRQTDLRLLQGALEQYRSDLGFYPDSMTLASTPIVFNSKTGNPKADDIADADVKTYMNNTPVDPQSPTFRYDYVGIPSSCNDTNAFCTSYCLYAKLEGITVPNDLKGCTEQSFPFSGRTADPNCDFNDDSFVTTADYFAWSRLFSQNNAASKLDPKCQNLPDPSYNFSISQP